MFPDLRPTSALSRHLTLNMGSVDGRRWSLRRLLVETLSLLQVIAVIFVVWKGLSISFNTPFPMMIVTSESMEPAFQIGDLLLITNRQQLVLTGDLPVCWLPGMPYPMIHRVVQMSWDADQRLDHRRSRS